MYESCCSAIPDAHGQTRNLRITWSLPCCKGDLTHQKKKKMKKKRFFSKPLSFCHVVVARPDSPVWPAKFFAKCSLAEKLWRPTSLQHFKVYFFLFFLQNDAKLPASMLMSCPGWSLMTWTLCFDLSQSETAERSRLDKRLSRSRKTEMSTYIGTKKWTPH